MKEQISNISNMENLTILFVNLKHLLSSGLAGYTVLFTTKTIFHDELASKTF